MGESNTKQRDYGEEMGIMLVFIFLALPFFIMLLCCACICFNRVCFPRGMTDRHIGYPMVNNNLTSENTNQPQSQLEELKELAPLELTGMAAACNHYLRTVVHNDLPTLHQENLGNEGDHHLSEAASAFTRQQNNIQSQNATYNYDITKVVKKEETCTEATEGTASGSQSKHQQNAIRTDSENTSSTALQNRPKESNIKVTPQNNQPKPNMAKIKESGSRSDCGCCSHSKRIPNSNQPQRVVSRIYDLPSPKKPYKVSNKNQKPLDKPFESKPLSMVPAPTTPPNSDSELDSAKPEMIFGTKMLENQLLQNNLSVSADRANSDNSLDGMPHDEFEMSEDCVLTYDPDLLVIQSMSDSIESASTGPRNTRTELDTTVNEMILAHMLRNNLASPDSTNHPIRLDNFNCTSLGMFEECIFTSDPDCTIDSVDSGNVTLPNFDTELPSVPFSSTFFTQMLQNDQSSLIDSANPLPSTSIDSIPVPFPMGGASRLIFYRNSHIDVQDLQGSNSELSQSFAASSESLLSVESQVPQNLDCNHNEFEDNDHYSNDKE